MAWVDETPSTYCMETLNHDLGLWTINQCNWGSTSTQPLSCLLSNRRFGGVEKTSTCALEWFLGLNLSKNMNIRHYNPPPFLKFGAPSTRLPVSMRRDVAPCGSCTDVPSRLPKDGSVRVRASPVSSRSAPKKLPLKRVASSSVPLCVFY